jgi:hypothetical protein
VLATMHGASFSGDGAAALKALGDHYDARLRVALAVSLMLWTAPPLARECHGGTKFVQCMSLFMADTVVKVQNCPVIISPP